MHHVLEPLGEVGADAPGRREIVGVFGMLGLEALELLEHHVEVEVGDLGRVEQVVVVVVAVDLPPQRLDFFLCIHDTDKTKIGKGI